MRIQLLIVYGLLLGSCGENSPSASNEPNGVSEGNLSDTCNCEELSIDSTGIHLKDENPFTGTCVSYYQGTESKYLEKNVLEGKMHGKVTYYDREGNILLEEFYENGSQKRTGGSESGLTCDCSELKIQKVQGYSVYKLDDVPFTGKCEKKYDDSDQLYMESSYKDGLLDGYTVYYDRSGGTILMEKYERGVLSSSIY